MQEVDVYLLTPEDRKCYNKQVYYLLKLYIIIYTSTYLVTYRMAFSGGMLLRKKNDLSSFLIQQTPTQISTLNETNKIILKFHFLDEEAIHHVIWQLKLNKNKKGHLLIIINRSGNI